MKKYCLLPQLNYRLLNNAKTGFSLIELMIVVALITVVIGLATLNINFLDRLFIKAELQKLNTICHYLRRKAMLSNTVKQIVLNNDNYSYEDKVEQFDHALVFNALPNVLGPPSDPHKIITDPITFKNNTIVFYPDGTVSSGTVYVTDKHKKYQYALTIPISHVPYIRIYSYDKNWNLIS